MKIPSLERKVIWGPRRPGHGTSCRCCGLEEPGGCSPPSPGLSRRLRAPRSLCALEKCKPLASQGGARLQKKRRGESEKAFPCPHLQLAHDLLERHTSRAQTTAGAALRPRDPAPSRPCPRPSANPRDPLCLLPPAKLPHSPRARSGTSSPQKAPPGVVVAKVPRPGRRRFLLFMNGPGEGPGDWRIDCGPGGRIK